LINSTILINFYGPGTVVLPNTNAGGSTAISPSNGTPLLSNQFGLIMNSNGGVGTIPEVIGTIGTSISVPASVGMSKPGYVFLSWNTAVDGSGVKFIPTESVIASSLIVLYAQWSILMSSSSSTLLGSISIFAVNSSVLTPQLKTQIHNLAILLLANKQKHVTAYGYTTYSTATASNLAISQARANAVAQYLRTQLTAMSVFGVLITAKGEGSVRGQVAAAYRRVEIFV
jgi:outer membrane protein OmpA-like peptidoglycan-associated protein